jgi:hypothetical protein
MEFKRNIYFTKKCEIIRIIKMKNLKFYFILSFRVWPIDQV